jgi:hypothetical protein
MLLFLGINPQIFSGLSTIHELKLMVIYVITKNESVLLFKEGNWKRV